MAARSVVFDRVVVWQEKSSQAAAAATRRPANKRRTELPECVGELIATMP
jgi:hypothetical protein